MPEDDEVIPVPDPEPVEADAVVVPEAAKPKKAAAAKPENSVLTPSEPGAVVGNDETDPVYLSKFIYGLRQKSLSVHHAQRRLGELGYGEAIADHDGRIGDLTAVAISRFQRDQGIAGDGAMNEATLTALFLNDPNVTVHFS